MRLACLVLGAIVLTGCNGSNAGRSRSTARGAAPAASATSAAKGPYANLQVFSIGAGSARVGMVGIDTRGMMTVRVSNLGPDVIQNPGVQVDYGDDSYRTMGSLQSPSNGGQLAGGQSVIVVVGPIPPGVERARLMPLGSSETMRNRRRN